MEKVIKFLEGGEYHYATVRSVGDLAKLKTDSKSTIVEAINEIWSGGGGDPSKLPKPDGYDQLVQDVADVVNGQQEINKQWIEWQKEEAQLTEERKQAYLQAMKEMQESIDKAKADAEALNDKTAKLDEQITKTFSDLDTNIQNMHEQLQKEADRMNEELSNTKSDLSKVRTDLQNAQLDNGKIHDELTKINGKFEHKVWNTDLDPLKEQIARTETDVQQTKDELLGKASRQDLDTVSNTVSNLDAQLKETAKGVEISVKKDELGGEIAEALVNKTNILLGTRRFTTNKWTQRDHVEICSDPWKGFLVAKQNSPIEGILQAYDVKAGTTYTFSLFAKMDTIDANNKPQIILAQNNLDTSLDTKIDVWRKEIDDITSDFKRYSLTFTPNEDCTIYPHVISNSNNPVFVCGYQLEIGKDLTPWEPNQEDVGDYVEKSEAQFNVYNDKIQALTEKQRQQGDTQEKLRTEVTQTAEGVKQVSESLKDTNGDITKLRGDLERTADHMKSEYETYTNKAVGQISDSTLNLIRNSSFQNKDEDFAQWQNISAKANIRQDENGLRWVELTQSGMTTDNIVGLTSNYFNIKQGKVTVAVDIKSGAKADLDIESVLTLELYDANKKRVDFTRLTLNDLGLSKSLLGDHQVHRGLYRLGIDRNDAKYMTVKALLARNGDLYFTNFSARLSSIDDGAYEPNPDDINQQILKQNTKIEQNAKEVAIKANSVDVTRDIKSAIDGIQVGGVNLLLDTDLMSAQYWTANSSKAIYRNRRVPGTNNALLDTSISSWISFNYKQKVIFDTSKEYTFSAYVCSLQKGQSVTLWLNTDDTYKGSFQSATLTNSTDDYDWQRFSVTFKPKKSEAYLSISTSDIKTGQGVWLSSLMLEEGNKATSYTKAPEDTSAEIKSAKEAAIQVASDQINIHVNELSTSFDDKLNKRVNEVKNASEKFTSDGIEQTVTKITNVKNDVDRLGDKVDGIKIGGRNLVTGTNQDIIIDDTSNTQDKGWRFASVHLTQQPKLGDQITVSAESTLTGKGDLSKYYVVLYNETTTNQRSTSATLISGKRSKGTLTVNFLGGVGETVLLIYAGMPEKTAGKKNVVHHLKVEFGNQATDYTHAPEDIDKKIDTQTLDSANIDDLKTQGHYFVKNLTGNPIGGWVYVDVTGNNGDRVKQDVYQDGGTKHMYRRWFGDGWTGWDQSASINDLNNTKTEVTASVKNLGDRVTTEVNSLTKEIKNNNGGGINVVKYSSMKNVTPDDLRNHGWWIHDQAWMNNNNSIVLDNRNGTANMDITQTVELEPDTDYTLSFHLIFADMAPGHNFDAWSYLVELNTPGQSVEPYVDSPRLMINSNERKLNTQVIHTTKDTHAGILFFRAQPGTKIEFNEVKLERGNIGTPWSPNPDDTIEAIKEVNTKWDVANGQIQGKVTATDVNNILNGKGYATQSWAQTMFQMKSDSITLQAVRDNITNGIQNQVNSINNRVANGQIGERNLAVGTNRGTAGWKVDPGNGESTTDIALLNGVKGLHISNTKKSTSWWVVQYPFDMGKLKPNTYYTISFDIQTSENTNGGLIVTFARGDSTGGPFIDNVGDNVTTNGGEITHITRTYKTGGSIENNGQAFYINSLALGQSNDVNIANLMIVEGTQGSVWKSAPEDQGNGQNLLRGTADFSWPTGIGFNGNFNTSFERFDDTSVAFHLWGDQGGGIYTRWGGAFPDGQLQVGEAYTFSFDIKGSGKFLTVHNESEPERPPITLNGTDVPSEWSRMSVTGTIQALDKAFIIYFRDNFDVRIKNVKIERGSVATPWTPHPFDDKDKGINLLKSTAYWNPNDWNHISDGAWYDDNWTDNLGHKAYGRGNVAWDGLGQTVYVTPGVYTWSAQIYLNGLEENESAGIYYGDSQYSGTVQAQAIRQPGLFERDKWINYSTTFYVRNAGNLCVRPELNQNHGYIHVGSQKLEHGMVATPWSPSPYDDKNATITLDTADVNNMKVQGHYFVKNLANSPIAGWVYVDVSGNNLDRLKQDVYQDGGYEHKSRRWFGDSWTEWTTDVNNKNVVSQINITPDQIKIASNKIVIDGNTNIHGTLSVPEVRLQGKSGMIGLDGNKGIVISSADTLFQTRVTKFGMDFLTTTNGQKEIMGGISTGYSTNNGNLNGISIVLDTQQKLGAPYGGDFFSIGNTTHIDGGDNRTWNRAMDYDASGQLHNGGFMWYEHSTLAGDGRILKIDGAYDPLMFTATKHPTSNQSDKYQPTIRLGYDDKVYSNAGITFLWNQVKPFGDTDISNVGSIWFNGQRFVFGWANHGRMFDNQRQPAFMRLDDKGGIMSGIAFAPGSTWDLGSGAWNITASVMSHGG